MKVKLVSTMLAFLLVVIYGMEDIGNGDPKPMNIEDVKYSFDLDDEEIEGFFSEFDVNRDGLIDLHEQMELNYLPGMYFDDEL